MREPKTLDESMALADQEALRLNELDRNPVIQCPDCEQVVELEINQGAFDVWYTCPICGGKFLTMDLRL